MKNDLFDSMMSGFDEAIKYRRGQNSRLRVSRFAPIADLKPIEIQKIRSKLGFKQSDFALYLGTSLSSVRSWEQGVRKPRSTALRLLTIAKQKPAMLLVQAHRTSGAKIQAKRSALRKKKFKTR
jgi:putative transcriptional regulator